MVPESSEFSCWEGVPKDFKGRFGLSQCFTQSVSHLPRGFLSEFLRELVVEQGQDRIGSTACEGCYGTPPSPSIPEVGETWSVATDWGQSSPGAPLLQECEAPEI